MKVIKRNGQTVDFDFHKVIAAIRKAFDSQNESYSQTAEFIVDAWVKKRRNEGAEEVSVEEIQDVVEDALMKVGAYKVAKAFILYREKRKNARFIRERIDYMDRYSNSSDNAATASETDPNANMTMKNIANLEGEVYKTTNRTIQRQRMKDKLNEMYPELAGQYEKDLNNHIIYVHDEASTPTTKFYCQAVSLYPLMMEGVGNIDGVTPSAPNDLQSFSGQLTNLMFLLSSQCKGAVACLYGKQPLIINNKEITIKDFVNEKWNNPIMANDGWEYCNVDGNFVFEDGKNVLIKKVFRKRYSNKIYKIKSKKGFVALTSKDHKFKVLRNGTIEEVAAENLHLYDTVFVNNNLVVDFESRDYKEGWIKGMLLGDGCLTQPGMVQLSVNYNQDYYGELFNEYCELLYGDRMYRCKGNKCYQYEARKKDFIDKLKSDIDGKNCYNKNISINDKSLEYLSGILDGILCADGGDYHSIGISLANKHLINTIKCILDIFRIHYSYREVPEHDNKSKLYCLSICTEVLKYTQNFKLRLGKNKKEKEVYYYSGYSRVRNVQNKEVIKSTGKGRFAFNGYKLDVITDIDTFDNDDEFVYEIETESHWYNCGGFITHNCGEYFVVLNYYAIKEFGEKWYEKIDCTTTTEHCLAQRTIRDSIYKAFKQFVWGINQPASNRGYQSPFINISYFDHTYFNSLFKNFYYPDGTQPEWKAIDMLQRLFMKWFNKLRLKQVLAFPVETFAMVHDGKDIVDKEYKELCAEMYAEGHSFFTYISDSADSLASCCFSGDTKVLWKTTYDGVHLTSLKELHETKWEPYKKNLTIFHNGSWVRGKSIKLPNRKMFKVTTLNNKEFYMTDNHINVTLDGEKFTKDLTTNDYLMFNTQTLESIAEQDKKLTYEQGFMIGMFLGDGSFGSEINGTIYDVNFSLNASKTEKCYDIISKAIKQCGIDSELKFNKEYNNVYPHRASSKELVEFISYWTNWERGTYSYNKELNLNCLMQSSDFRRGILYGWYATDGGNSNRCYTTSKKLAECMEVLITSLGMHSIINVFDRTDEKVVIREEEYNRNYPLYCVRFYEKTNHRVSRNQEHTWTKRNNSIYFKIKSIECVEYSDDVYCIEINNNDEPYFTLPCGLITHNCRLKNELQENTFSPTSGLTGIMTGSCNVITLNINRITQDCDRSYGLKRNGGWKENSSFLADYLKTILERVYKYHITFKTMLYDLEDNKMFAASNGGYIHMNKLYSTIGINGLNEAARYLGMEVSNNDEYISFLQLILGTIKEQNKQYSIHDKKRPFLFNSEVVPGEGLGGKNYRWDKEDGYYVPEDKNLYNSYFYDAHDKNTSVLDKFVLHGRKTYIYTDGGSAAHINLDDHLSKQQYLKLIDFAIEEGTSYFTFNIPNSKCMDCGHIIKKPVSECPHCGSKNIRWYTRVIGFLRAIDNFGEDRQEEAANRFYNNGKEELC